ncbi:hypothetical protein FOVG_16591 [Fusarium oxysporum f. sp. pisi HDV247]|uniref:Zn(2)-C6 fungal-type domain-containing protein n=1 Tax=Fusarium oxysporum f. sp. pisi HDV247 TaxID=1080344 RepID=W9NHD0_FUSOX|nr:hypothetical protein FOVG_16591 [Fusarium oxysporum f. sp. pisi HDV247]
MTNSKPRITRTRSGCLTCRRRHTKCDEAKPHCHTCSRLEIPCSGYGVTLAFRDNTHAVRERIQRQNKRKDAASADAKDRRQSEIDKLETQDSDAFMMNDMSAPEDHARLDWLSPVPETNTGAGEMANYTQSLCPSLTSSPKESTTAQASTSKSNGLVDLEDTVDDAWLSEHFPPNLSPVLQEIWEGVGYSHPVLKLSLLALRDAHKPDIQKDALELYSRSLQALSEYMPSQLDTISITDAVVLLAVLTILEMLEMTFGSFLGGITHCKQADYIVKSYMKKLVAWGTGSRMIRAWVPVKCWYSIQCAPWEEISHPFPAEVRESLWDALQPSSTSPDILLALLCAARKLNLHLTLVRLLGRGSSHQAFHNWSRQLQLFGKQAPEEQVFNACSEQDILAGFAALRARLDHWHSQQDVGDLPTIRATSECPEPSLSLPSSIGPDPLVFRSSRTASNYLRYVAAQALASTESLEALLSRKPGDSQPPDRWTRLTLQIVAGLEPSEPLQEGEGVSIGLAWILLNIVLLRGPDADIIYHLKSALPRLREVGNSRCAPCPFWALGDVIQKIEDQQAHGRVVLHLEAGITAGEELSVVRSTPVAYQALLFGYDVMVESAFSIIKDMPYYNEIN